MQSYVAYRIAEFLSRALPRRFSYWVGLRFADLFHCRNAGQRAAIMRNLRHIYAAQGVEAAEGHLRGMARKLFQYFGKYLVDFFRYAQLPAETIQSQVSFQHLDYLKEAHALGRGVLLVSAHFGNWELGGAVLTSLGYTVNVVVLPQRQLRLERLLEHHRARRGLRSIPLGSAARGALRCLRRGEMVALLADRALGGRTTPCLFFGRRVDMPVGPAFLSCRSGAPIVPVFLMRQEDDTFLFRFHPPILFEHEGTVAAVQQAIARSLEAEIAARPHQWFIFDDFWHATPPRSPP